MDSPDSPVSALRRMLSDGQKDAAGVARLLDSASHEQRVEAVRGLSPGQIGALYRLVEGFGELSLADLVPEGAPALQPVRHYGCNTLPVFRSFEKRFFRTAAGDEIGGANFQALSPVTGPGYFCARSAGDRPEVLIDYQRLPAQTPEGWPKLQDNEHGISRWVYGYMLDRLRRVSQHVSVGSASRNGRELGAYFVLCRQDAPR
jgi:hypothetical protein